MTEEEYFEFHLKTVWKVYQKLNANLYTHKEDGFGIYEEIKHFPNNEEKFKVITSYEELYDSVMKEKNRFFIDNDYSQIKSSLFQTLRNFNKEEFLKEFIDEIIFNSPEDYSTAFIENRFKYPIRQGTSEYLTEILPKMSYENALCYFNQVKTWNEIGEIINNKFQLITQHPHGKEFLFIGLKNCFSEDKNQISSYQYNSVIDFLLEKYSHSELKTFDFLPNIDSFLSSKNRSKNIIIDQEEESFTTRIKVDCQHAMNIYYYKNTTAGSYGALVDTLMKNLKNDPTNNILDVNVIHKYDENSIGQKKNYKISEVFIDTKEYDPNLKKRVSHLINEYIKDYIDTLKASPNNFDAEKFTENWLMQENLQSELVTNKKSKQKVKKV
jgi:hypothetical protein